jgi:hypothetical protein
MFVFRSVLPATLAGVAVVGAPVTARDVPVLGSLVVVDVVPEPLVPDDAAELPEVVVPLKVVGFVDTDGLLPTPVGAFVTLLLL